MASGEVIKFGVTGMRELNRNAQKLETRLRKRVYSKAVRKASKPVLAKAITKAPGRTGTIKRSLKSRADNKAREMKFGMKITVIGGKFSSERTAKRRGVGKSYRPDESVRYYRFTELGTKYHPAKPYLKPALKASGAQFLSTLQSDLRAELKKPIR